MNKINQKTAVYNAVLNVKGDIQEGTAVVMSKEERAQVNLMLVTGFQEGTVQLDKEYETDAELKNYCSGLLSNWLRKDSRLNGGGKYVPKNPGTRVGASDPQLKALRQLMQTKSDESERNEIQTFIDTRVAQIKASKVKDVQIDYSALPEALRIKQGN